jgi:colanic acid biosynthesis glycosyl transferase WcaI
MRILILSQYFWPENFQINDVARGLRDAGHELVVVTGLPNYPGGSFFSGYGYSGPYSDSFDGIEVRRAPLIPRGDSGKFRLMINFATMALSHTLLAPWLARGHFDVMLVYEPSPITVGIPARFIKFLKGIPLAFWVQDLWPQSLSATQSVNSAWILDAVDSLVRWIYRGCTFVLVQSRAFIPQIEAQGVASSRIAYMPNIADAVYHRRSPSNDDPAAKEFPSGFRVVYAGNIGAAQDFPTILDAAELLREQRHIQWIIIGEGRVRGWVEAEVKRRGLQSTVTLLGSRPGTQMPAYFSHADVLLASLRREPIFAYTIPSKIQSYLACGKPIVAALDGEGARVVREADAGWTVPPENSNALANAVLTASQMDNHQLVEMGHRAEQYFHANFDRKMLLSRLENVLKAATQESA